MSNPEMLSLHSTIANGIVVIHIDGILDATTRGQFTDYLETEAEDHGPDMILDLGGVTFMDSRALGLIVHQWQSSTTAGGHFALVRVNHRSSKVMRVTGLSERLPLFDTLEEALAALAA